MYGAIFMILERLSFWNESIIISSVQGPRSKFSSGGAKEECEKENLGAGGHACGFLFNFFKVTENVNNDKTVNFFSHLQ